MPENVSAIMPRNNRVSIDANDGAIHIDAWTMHEIILTVASGGQFFTWNAESENFSLWVLSNEDRLAALEKYGLGGTLHLDWVVKAFKPYLAPH